MSEFDLRGYLDQRYGPSTGTSKVNALQQASDQKIQQLQDFRADAEARRAQAQANQQVLDAQNQGAWANRLGFEEGSLGHQMTNTFASYTAGAGRFAGNIASLPPSIAAELKLSGLTQEDFDAYTAYQNGVATPEQQQRLFTKRSIGGDPNQREVPLPEDPHAREAQLAREALQGALRKRNAGKHAEVVPMERIQSSDNARQLARDINEGFNFQGIVNQTGRSKLSQDLTQDFAQEWGKVKNGSATEKIDGVVNLLTNIGSAAVNNKQAAFEFVVENVPQLISGMAGGVGMTALSASNLGYAVDNYQKGIENFQKENNGAYPDENQRKEMALWALSTAVAEQTGDVVSLGGAKALKGAVQAAKQAAKEITSDAARGAVKAIARTPGAILAGAATEGATEGFQSYAEGEAQLKPASAEDIYESGAVGAIVGGAMRGAPTAAAQVVDGVTAVGNATVSKMEEQKAEDDAKAAALKQATESGDVSGLIDPKKKTYAPDVAVSALFNRSQGATEEVKQQNLNQATQIVDALSQRVEDVRTDLNSLSPEAVEGYKTQLAETQQELRSVPEGDPARAELTERAEVLSSLIADANPKVTKPIEQELARLESQLKSAQDYLGNFTREVAPKDVNVQDEVQTLRSAITPEEAQASAEKIVSLAMRDSSRLDEDVAASLAADKSIALSTEQRIYLRAFSESRIAENELSSLEKVNKEVLYGSPKNVGLVQYRQRMQAAISAGNQEMAERQLAQLQSFAESHTQKAEVAAEAIARGLGTQIVRTQDGWAIPATPLTAAALKKNGGLTLNTGRLVQAIQKEADAISKAATELALAYELRFNSSTTTAVNNVQNTAQPSTPQEGTQRESGESGQDSQVGSVQSQETTGNADGRVARRDDVQATDEAVKTDSKLDKRLYDIVVKENYDTLKDPAAVLQFAKAAKEALTRLASIPEDDRTDLQADLLFKLRDNFRTNRLGEFDWQMLFDGMNPTEAQETELNNIIKNEGTASQNTEEATEGAPIEVGQEGQVPLEVFTLNREEEAQKPFQQQNLVAVYLRQAKTQVLGKTKDFLSSVGLLNEALPNQEIAPAQEDAFTFLKNKVKEWGPKIDGNIELMNPDFRYRNPVQFLVKDGQAAFDENVHTAMTLAVLNYVSQFGTRTLFNDWEDINTILHRPKETLVTPKEFALLRDVGTQAVVVTGSIGALASRVLGLRDSADAPKNLLPKVEAGLGAHIVDLMLEQGILIKNQVTGAELNEALELEEGEQGAYKAAEKYTFYRLNTDENGDFTPAVEELYTAVRNAKGAFTDLFGVELGVVAPKLKPSKFNQLRISGTDRGIPKPLKEAQDRLQQTPFKIKKDHWKLLNSLPEEVVLALAGFKEVTPAVQKSLRKGIESKNASIQKGWNSIKEFVTDYLGNDLDREYFIEPNVWINQRVGVKTQLVDPQANKLHRYVSRMSSWSSKVSMDDLDNFRLRVMEGLGDKTDETPDAVTLTRFDSLVSQPAIANAVQAIRKSLQGQELSQDEANAIKEGVDKGGEVMHSLDALIALAKYEEAKVTGATSFDVDMSVEDDGKTNGPMLSYLLFGASYDVNNLEEVLARGGFYTQASGLTQYSQWRSQPGNEDLYQDTMRVFNTALSQVANEAAMEPNSVHGKKLAAIYAFTGTLMNEETNKVEKAGRNIVKTPLQAIFFGSSSKRSAESMADKLIEGILDRVQKLPSNPDDRLPLIKDLNTLGMKISLDTPIETLMEAEFSKQEIQHLQREFMAYVGDYIKEKVDQHFAPFMAAKQTMNTAANLTFNLYNSVFKAMKAKKLQELVDAGVIPVSKGKNPVPLFDLSKNQEKEIHDQLKGLFPVMHSWLSQREGNLANGLRMAEEDASLGDNSMYLAEVKTKSGTHRVRSQERNLVKPGVTMLSASVHSFDSGISHSVITPSINNHDARTTGLNELNAVAKELNKATWDGLLEYSPLGATADALSRVVIGLAQKIKEGSLPQEAIDAIKEGIKEQAAKAKQTPQEFIDATLAGIRYEQARADTVKLQFMSELGAVDQYPLEGGSYIVSDADRQAAQEKLKTVPTGLNAQEDAALNTIFEAFGNQVKPATVKPEPKVQPTSPFGELGTPNRASNDELVSFLESTPNVTVGQLIPKVYSLVQATEQTGFRDFSLKLLKMLNKAVDLNMPVKYITKLTPETGTIDRVEGAAAWFTHSEKPEIVLIGTDFKNAVVRPSTVIHELVHASVFQTMQAERNKKASNPKYKSDVLGLMDDLELLRTKAKELIERNGLTQFNNAVANIDELVAYGLMQPKFQQEVLAKINIEAKKLNSTTSQLVNGLRKFIENITQILFAGFKQKPSTQDVDGMSLLIANTTAILSQAATTASPSVRPTSLAMMGDPLAAVSKMDTVALFNALSEGVSKHSPAFNARIQALLTGVVNKLHGPFGAFYDKASRKAANDPLDVMVKAIQTGKAPFAADVLGSPFRASNQELFAMEQIEATVRAALEGGETSTTSLAYNQLSKLYKEAYQRIKPEHFLKQGGDWATATAQEKADAQAQYDFVFKIDLNKDNRSTYLSRFAALGLGHENFGKLLEFNTNIIPTAAETGISLVERLQRIIMKVLDFFGTQVMHTYAGQPANEKLEALVDRLVDIEAKNRLSLVSRKNGWIAEVEGKARDWSKAARAKVGELAGSETIRNASSGYIRGAGALVRVVANDKVERFIEGMSRMHDESNQKRHSFVRDMLTEVQGLPDRMMRVLLEAKRANEQIRQDMIASTEKTVLGAFANEGKDLTLQEKESVTQALLRTGAHTLLKGNRFSFGDIQSFVEDEAARKKAIRDIENELQTVVGSFVGSQGVGNFFAYYVEKANVLGYYKATGHVRRAKMVMNAYNIANLNGTVFKGKVSTKDAAKAEPLIEALVSLYALDYTGSVDLRNTAEVMRKEANRADGNNGVEFLLLLQTHMEQESKDKLFNGNPALMVHGYTPELYNSRTEIKIANAAEGRNLELQGWKRVGNAPQDPADPVNAAEPHSMYVLKGAGLQPYSSGAFSLTDLAAKGNKMHSGFLNPRTSNGLANAQNLSQVMHAHQGSDVALLRAGTNYKRQPLDKFKGNYMVPVINEQGDVVNFRYMMNEYTKDTILERDSRFEKVFGAFAGSVYDKETSRTQNRKTVEALKEEYFETYKERPKSFVLVGRDSDDPKLREIWDMLPQATKDDVESVWGYRGMMVRTDSLNVLFGYRQYSLAEMFRKEPEARNELEKLATWMVEWTLKSYARHRKGMTEADAEEYAKRAAIYVTRGEQVWQEFVKEIKDIIVIKSAVVLAGNIWSNLSYLWLSGVPIKTIATHHKVALQAALSFLADDAELKRLILYKEAGYLQGQQAETDREIARLQDAIARNPVKEIIDAGLMPTIVDDVTLQDDPYSYKTNLSRWVEEKTKNVPEGLKKAAKQVYMTKDTGIYQSLSRLTQLSDFVARYTLYQHLIHRAENPLSKEDAILSASEAFVNYDVPLPRGLQYTDNMGITMFTKYFLRIQRVLVKMLRENPARVIAMLGLSKLMSLGPIVLESSWFEHLGNNPLNWGAFQYPTTLDELATAQAGLKLID